jgi:hypothetical protein
MATAKQASKTERGVMYDSVCDAKRLEESQQNS